MLFIAGVVGGVSGLAGNYLSVEASLWMQSRYPDEWLALPTGPSIVIVASALCIFSLLFAPKRGLLLRGWRILLFRQRCLQENLLKAIWRIDGGEALRYQAIRRTQSAWAITLRFTLQRLVAQGWLEREGGCYVLTKEGAARAAHVVRLHRLWEVYLANYLGVGAERVHPNAEEMEHIITPELEKELTDLLQHPTHDPHFQPIPPRRV